MAVVEKRNLKYIYGPVSSWRLGSSLGVDPISQKDKICTFDCVYCQLGGAGRFLKERKIYVPAEWIVEEISSLPPVKIDYITFSGRGEPTLAENLGEMIKALKTIRKEKTAVITNSSIINRADVQEDLSLADFVVAKLDACSPGSLEAINNPMEGISLDVIIDGIKRFRAHYQGKLALQIMFVDQNKDYVEEIAALAREIGPDEVQLNTPLRPCGVKPVSRNEMGKIEGYFTDMNCVSVYEKGKKKVAAISGEDTLRRRGKI